MDSLKTAFPHLQHRPATKLQNQRLLKIGFHTLKHWKAVTLYHRTKDPYYIRDFPGHKSQKNNGKYAKIEKTMFADYGKDEFSVKVASTQQELTALLEVGFEWVGVKDNLIFLRKRK